VTRSTRLDSPPSGDAWLKRAWRAITELQNASPAAAKRWAHLTLSANQTGVATTDLVKFNTFLAKRGDFAVTPAGLITLEPGYYRLTAALTADHSTANNIDVAWYHEPDGAELATAQRGFQLNSGATNDASGGVSGDAVAYLHVSSPTKVGARVEMAGGTSDIDASYARALIEEVDAWDD
jgi:hypothetical protein